MSMASCLFRSYERVTDLAARTAVAEISDQLDALTVEELRTVREHERRTKNRETLLEQIDRKIRAANS